MIRVACNAVVAAVLAACGADEDVCAGRGDACIALRVDGPIAVVDQLELDLLYGGVHATITARERARRSLHAPDVGTGVKQTHSRGGERSISP